MDETRSRPLQVATRAHTTRCLDARAFCQGDCWEAQIVAQSIVPDCSAAILAFSADICCLFIFRTRLVPLDIGYCCDAAIATPAFDFDGCLNQSCVSLPFAKVKANARNGAHPQYGDDDTTDTPVALPPLTIREITGGAMKTAVLRTNESRDGARYSTQKTSAEENQVLRSIGKLALQAELQLSRLLYVLRHEGNV